MSPCCASIPCRSGWWHFLLTGMMMLTMASSVLAGDLTYAVSAISPELLKNADMVVRVDETVLEIGSLTKITEKVHLVFTVLRESAKEKATLRVFYDNDSKIISLGGRIYNAAGRLTRQMKSDDIADESAVPYGTIYSDDRVKYARLVAAEYPYTVEYEFERFSRQLVQYPKWRLVDDFNTSVEYARLLIRPGIGTTPRYLSLNFPGGGSWPEKLSDSTLSWELKNVPAIVAEPLNPGLMQISPVIYIAPSQVVLPGQDPLPATWNAYGKWISWLNRDRGVLPEDVAAKIRQLTSGIADPVSKLKLIYTYFQENTRYISVQIGIGGYQPATALSVAKNGYGDCKALANYLRSLLDCAGIRSYYTLVMAGKDALPVRTDFPGLQFNHAILCVPLEKDTVWLECTSQTIPFGFLGSFTDNRNVLLITPDGGVLARTPAYPASYNCLIRTAVIDLDSTGRARISSTTHVSGLRYELFDGRQHETPAEQKKHLQEEIKLPAVNVVRLSYREDAPGIPGITESLEITIPAYAAFSGNLVFIPLNIFNRVNPMPAPEETRNFPFDPGPGFTDTDSIVVKLPGTFTPDNLPEATTFSSGFGSYSITVTYKNNELLYVRRYACTDGDFLPKEYSAYQAFIKQVSKADRTKAVLKRYLK
ncbi:MAG: DUF3857 domain-containing protein [bacterium]